MRSAILLVFSLFLSTCAFAQHRGLGFRLGEPLAITYKQYLPNNKAMEFMLGTAPKGFAKNYYINSFDEHYSGDYHYLDYRVSNIIYLAGRYQIHHQIPTDGIEGKLDWYWGGGLVFKTARVKYVYDEEVKVTYDIYTDTRTDIDFGPEAMAGLEFTLQDVPVTIFAEMSSFFELTDRTTVRVFAGTGVRVNF